MVMDYLEMLEAATKARPSSRQYECMRMGLVAFLHFSLNTFYMKEWGDGTEDPIRFNPQNCDADKWVGHLARTGFKLAILTCKHHGGFCLWPSKFTEYSVKNTPWKQGKGDLVRDFSEACRRHGIKFGVYLSPWDRHDTRYANDSDAYNEYFLNQLTELLTGYGPVHEVWFDGACVPVNGKRQHYSWEKYYALIRELQPDAVISGIGPDVRWCGNEAGKARPAEWSVVDLDRNFYAFNRQRCNNTEIGQLGENPVWYPSEVDMSIRPNWFYHKSDDVDVRSLHYLIQAYFNSVGHNSVLLLNVPPDCNGEFHEADVKRLDEFRAWLDDAFAVDYGIGSTICRLSSTKRDDGRIIERFRLKLNGGHCFNCIELAEDILHHGQLVEEYSMYAEHESGMRKICEGKTIGFKELVRLEKDCQASEFELETISRAPSKLLPLKFFQTPHIPDEENAPSWLYYWGCKYTVPEKQGGETSLLKSETEPYESRPVGMPQSLTLTMEAAADIQGIAILPQQDGTHDGIPHNCACMTSQDGEHWTCAFQGELGNLAENPTYRKIMFDKVHRNVAYLRLEIQNTFQNEPYFKLQRCLPILTTREQA